MLHSPTHGVLVNFLLVSIGFDIEKLLIFESLLLSLFNLLLLALKLIKVVVVLIRLSQSPVLGNLFPQTDQTFVGIPSYPPSLMLFRLCGYLQHCAFFSVCVLLEIFAILMIQIFRDQLALVQPMKVLVK